MTTCSISKERLWNSVMELGEIGKDSRGGNTRVSLSQEDLQGREYLIDLMKKAGLNVRVDAVGNIIGELTGKNPDLPVVIAGSHVDTVIQGGKFDGALGVLGAVEAVRSIKEHGIELAHTVEVVSFTDEEGTRFGTGFIGSKGMIGSLSEAELDRKDTNGISYKEAFRAAGLNPEEYKKAARRPEEIKAYVELHIEQGRVLESENLSVGIVTDIQGPQWMNVCFRGQADHAGATPMAIRKDPSLAMAETLPHIERVAMKYDGVATVGRMEFKPGGVNIIPEEVNFSIDLRHINKNVREQMRKEIVLVIHKAAEIRGLEAEIEMNQDVDPESCSPQIIGTIESVCRELELPAFKMKCGAGHDALLMAKVSEFGMIFVRSEGGISHNPKEWTSQEDCVLGTQVLLETLLKLAE